MRRIGIDCRFAATNSGLGRYTRELVTHLLTRDDGCEYVLFTDGDTNWIPFSAAHVTCLEVAFPHYSFAEQYRFPRFLRRSGIDLLFSPHFNVPFFCPVPFVVTIHDLILHHFPNQASLRKRSGYKILMRRVLHRARHIIAVSDFTARDITDFYGPRMAKKITVIHEGVSESFSPRGEAEKNAVMRKYDIHPPFLLYVGNAKEHKNVQMLIDAFQSFPPSDLSLLLVTGGKETGTLTIASKRVRLLPGLAEEDLPALYSAARCFVSASLYEGFGLPLLEAAACGCPAIVTDGGAFREIAPPGTVLIPPLASAFAQAFMHLPSPPERVVLLSWDEAAAKTADILRQFA